MKRTKFGPLKLYDYKPTIIAEAGVNHGCKINLAIKYVKSAKKGLADAIKFQTYKAEKLVSKNSPAYWDTEEEKINSQYKLFKKFDRFNFEDYLKIFSECKKKKILYMSTIFDEDAIDKYNKLIKIFKISSSDINNTPLLRKIGKKKKYTIISTGGATIKEIKYALGQLNLPKNKVCIMHCHLNYPAKDKNLNLNYIKKLKKIFPGYIIGYSDHSKTDDELNVLEKAFDLGAQIIEKHFSHNKKIKGNDHYHSMDEQDLIKFNKKMLRKKIISGDQIKNIKLEQKSIKFARRSIFARKDILKNEKLTEKNLITLRPGNGVKANKWDELIGKRAKILISKGQNINIKNIC